MKRWLGLVLSLVMLLSPLGCSTNAPADSSTDDFATPTSVSTTKATTAAPTTTKTAAPKKTTLPTTKKPTTVQKTTAAPTTTTAMTSEQVYALLRDAMDKLTESFEGDIAPRSREFFIKSHVRVLDGNFMADSGSTEAYAVFPPKGMISSVFVSYRSDFLGCPKLQYQYNSPGVWNYGQYLTEPEPKQFKFLSSLYYVKNVEVIREAAMVMFNLPEESLVQDIQLRKGNSDFSGKECTGIKLSISNEKFHPQYFKLIRYGLLMMPDVSIKANSTILENSVEFFVDSDGNYLGLTAHYMLDVKGAREYDVTISVWGGQLEEENSERDKFEALNKDSFKEIVPGEWIVYDENDIP